MRIDTSGLYKAFDKMRENAESKGKTLTEQQSQIFLRMMKTESWKAAPSKDELFQTAQELKWRLKRKKGVSPAKELKRRMRARGTFARGWQILKVESAQYRIRVWLIDKSTDSAKVDKRHGVSKRTTEKMGGNFKRRVDNLAKQLTNDFNRG